MDKFFTIILVTLFFVFMSLMFLYAIANSTEEDIRIEESYE